MCDALKRFLTDQVMPTRKIGDIKAAFAKSINVTVRQLDRYLNGEQTPRQRVMNAIHQATGGVVRPEHFFPPS